MVILLLTFLGIALTITVAGLLLSAPRVQAPNKQGISYAARPVSANTGRFAAPPRGKRTATYRGDPVLESRRDGLRHASTLTRRLTYVEKQTIWQRILASVDLSGFLGIRRVGRTPWVGMVLIFGAVCIFCLVILRTLILTPGLILNTSLGELATATAQANKNDQPAEINFGLSGASKDLQRIGQMDRSQYDSDQEHSVWAAGACSATSMAEVINAYGHNYRITDILKKEIEQGAITADLGLLYADGIRKTVQQFGFKTVDVSKYSLDRLIQIANDGRPIIVNFPPGTWSAGGHVLVLRGGNENNVSVADSWTTNMTVLTKDQFRQWWRAFAFVIIPENDTAASI